MAVVSGEEEVQQEPDPVVEASPRILEVGNLVGLCHKHAKYYQFCSRHSRKRRARRNKEEGRDMVSSSISKRPRAEQ